MISPQLGDPSLNSSGFSVYLFVGGNLTNSGQSSGIDLPNIPGTFNSSGWVIGNNVEDLATGAFPTLASMLICNPQLRTTPASVTLIANTSTLAIAKSNGSSIGNLPLANAEVITSEALIGALATPDEGTTNPIIIASSIAASMFLESGTTQWDGVSPNPVLSLDSISANMDRFMSSASKAYSTGFASSTPANGTANGATFSTVPVRATTQAPGIALEADVFFGVLTIILIVTLFSLMIFVLVSYDGERVEFGIEGVLARVRVNVKGKTGFWFLD
jgi:hypothetical protein